MGVRALLVVGVHREERAFGEAVAARIQDSVVDVLVIPEGLSGRHPRQDQRFRFDAMHEALYRQLPGYAAGRYDLLIDLHAGLDETGLAVELYSAEPERLRVALAGFPGEVPGGIRVVGLSLDAGHDLHETVAATVIPEEVWRNSDFRYIGLEVFLPKPGTGDVATWSEIARLIEHLATSLTR